MLSNLWLIPVWPLLGFLINGFFGRRIRKSAVGIVACGSVGLSLVASLAAVPSSWPCPRMPVGSSR
jgi:NADH-quinone oxidoreductase subunit L